MSSWREQKREEWPSSYRLSHFIEGESDGSEKACGPHFAQTGRGTGPSESPKGDLASMGIKKQEERTSKLWDLG